MSFGSSTVHAPTFRPKRARLRNSGLGCIGIGGKPPIATGRLDRLKIEPPYFTASNPPAQGDIPSFAQ